MGDVIVGGLVGSVTFVREVMVDIGKLSVLGGLEGSQVRLRMKCVNPAA